MTFYYHSTVIYTFQWFMVGFTVNHLTLFVLLTVHVLPTGRTLGEVEKH